MVSRINYDEKYKCGDTVLVKLEDWALTSCKNPPSDGIAIGIFKEFAKDGSFSFVIDEKYKSKFEIIWHMNYQIVDVRNKLEVELL